MHHDVTVLNFDQTYTAQSFLEGEDCEWFDFAGIPGTHLFCRREALHQIARRLQSGSGTPITFIGSGNYHYVSYLLLSRIEKPFTLVLFDHHTDMLPSPSESLISCGSWVLESLKKIPMLKKVILIGVTKDWINQIPVPMRNKLTVFDEPLLQEHYVSAVHAVIHEIPTDSVYISVDKDVLNTDEAATVWDQGSMQLRQLLEIVDEIAAKKEICGFDVCGEYPLSPSERYRKQAREALAKNDHANHVILEHLKALELEHPEEA